MKNNQPKTIDHFFYSKFNASLINTIKLKKFNSNDLKMKRTMIGVPTVRCLALEFTCLK